MSAFAYENFAVFAVLAGIAGAFAIVVRRPTALTVFRVAEIVFAVALLVAQRSLTFYLPGVILAIHAVTPAFWNQRNP